jgi:AcrR family transcriptional regulator
MPQRHAVPHLVIPSGTALPITEQDSTVVNMVVRAAGVTPRRGPSRPPLLDVVAEVLVADPSASLAQVAEAAGIGRTTLHKHYATRDDLIRAVGHRAIDLWEAAVDAVAGDGDRDGGLTALTAAMIRIGPQLAFLWRTPAFDHLAEMGSRALAVESRTRAVLTRAQRLGLLAAGTPDWWLLNTFYSLVYVAAESVRSGDLAPRDAPDLVLATLTQGLGAKPASAPDPVPAP